MGTHPASYRFRRVVAGRLRNLTALGVGAIALVVLAVANGSCLGNPPFWDDLLGLHNQALFLAKHGFRWSELAASGLFWEGGSNVYRFGVLPWFYGLGYAALPAGAVHLAGHLFNLLCLAASASVLFAALRRAGVGRSSALFWCLAMLAEPVAAGQGAALGQEPPLLLAGAFAFFFAVRGRLLPCLAAVAAGALVKLTMVVWIPALLVCWFRNGRRLSTAVPAVALTAAMVLGGWIDSDGPAGGSGSFLWQIRGNLILLLRDVPMQMILLVSAAVATLWRLRRGGLSGGAREVVLYGWVVRAGFWGALLIYSVPLPRYTLLGVFPLFAVLAVVLRPRPAWAAAVLAAGILVSSGALPLPELPGAHRRSGEFLERSRAYLDEIDWQRTLCRILEREAFDRPIVAKWPLVQMLTVPEFGYVTRPLPHVYSAGILPRYAPVTGRVPPEPPAGALRVFECNSFEFFSEFGPPLAPEPGDEVMLVVGPQDSPTVVYRRPEEEEKR